VIPLVAFGRWVRRLTPGGAQGPARRRGCLCRRNWSAPIRNRAGLYQASGWRPARYGSEVEQAYDAARQSHQARSILTAVIIFIVFTKRSDHPVGRLRTTC